MLRGSRLAPADQGANNLARCPFYVNRRDVGYGQPPSRDVPKFRFREGPQSCRRQALVLERPLVSFGLVHHPRSPAPSRRSAIGATLSTTTRRLPCPCSSARSIGRIKESAASRNRRNGRKPPGGSPRKWESKSRRS